MIYNEIIHKFVFLNDTSVDIGGIEINKLALLHYILVRSFINDPRMLCFIDEYLNDFATLSPQLLLNSARIYANLYNAPVKSNNVNYKVESKSNFICFSTELNKDTECSFSEQLLLYKIYLSGQYKVPNTDIKEVEFSEDNLAEFTKVVVTKQADFMVELVAKVQSKFEDKSNKTCQLCPSKNAEHKPRLLSNMATDRNFDNVVVVFTEENIFDSAYVRINATFSTIDFVIMSISLGDITGLTTKQKNDSITQCSLFRNAILKKFNPKHIILIGAKSKSIFGIKGTLTDTQFKLIDDKYFIMPSTLTGISTGASEYVSLVSTKVDTIELEIVPIEPEIIVPKKTPDVVTIEPDDIKPTVTNIVPIEPDVVVAKEVDTITPEIESTVTNIEPTKCHGSTLFSIDVVGDNVRYIFIDSEGNKIVETKPLSITAYVYNKSYLNCPYVLDTTLPGVQSVQVNNQQKSKISKLLRS